MIITLLRKPLEGTVAENTLKHGCGAINIDATRIGSEIMVSRAMGSLGVMHDDNWESKPVEPTESTGRWPANFILTHKEGCELKGTKKIEGHKGYPNGLGGIWSKKYQEEHQKDRSLTDVKTVKDNEAWVGHADKDGEETIADWVCVEGCPAKELDQQSGNRKTTWVSASHKNNRQGDFLGALGHPKDQGYNDDGGASRFFKQFKKEDNP